MLYKLLSVLFCLNFLFSSIVFDTIWGECILTNNNSSITDSNLKKIINTNIIKLNKLHPQILESSFEIIVCTAANEEQLHIYNEHWHSSLGITYNKIDKIIVKDPAYAHINSKRFNQVVEHELNHLMINRLGVTQSIPRWFKEGYAMLVANEITLKHKIKVVRNARRGNLFKINELKNFSNLDNQEYLLAYAQSAVFVESLEQIYGAQIFSSIIESLKNNLEFDNAIYKTTSHNYEMIEELIISHIFTKYSWLKLIDFTDILFSLMPLLLVIGFILKSYKTKRIKEKWKIEEELEDLLQK